MGRKWNKDFGSQIKQEMESKWKKVRQKMKLLLRQNNRPPVSDAETNAAAAAALQEALGGDLQTLDQQDTTSTNVTNNSSQCPICFQGMGAGESLFTTECSHAFHYICLCQNVAHGNTLCPVCRARCKTLPIPPLSEAQTQPQPQPQTGSSAPPSRTHSLAPLRIRAADPDLFNDDEPLEQVPGIRDAAPTTSTEIVEEYKRIQIRLLPHVLSVPRSRSIDSFPVLLHIQAPSLAYQTNPEVPRTSPIISSKSPLKRRAPVDLVIVVDTSGSMCGTKISLLKKAIEFIIQNLQECDRLSVIAFSLISRRLFPLQRMTPTRRNNALQEVNALATGGGTNILEGLRKGVKVMEERRVKNSISSIMLLSDGRDTRNVNNTGFNEDPPNYILLIPPSILPDKVSGFRLPVHTFGFGIDHDPVALNSISKVSGGTYSSIEQEYSIQPAFAQCLGGLLSVVVKDVHVRIDCVDPDISIKTIQCGDYPKDLFTNQRGGTIDVGTLYADEERGFPIMVNVPPVSSSSCMQLLKVQCRYKNAFNEESVTLETQEAVISRTNVKKNESLATESTDSDRENVSIEVDSHLNRIRSIEAMEKAQAAAENGDLSLAANILSTAQLNISGTVSGQARDKLCVHLESELKQMQKRVYNRQSYEMTGRAYILSGLSTYSWQRATARGDFPDGSKIAWCYQTPIITELVDQSQESSLAVWQLSPETQDSPEARSSPSSPRGQMPRQDSPSSPPGQRRELSVPARRRTA